MTCTHGTVSGAHLFPPMSSVEGIKSVPSVCESACLLRQSYMVFPLSLDVAVSCGYDTQFAVRLVMGYTISLFTWSFWDYTQKSTTPILALKLSVSAIITPGGLPHWICLPFDCKMFNVSPLTVYQPH